MKKSMRYWAIGMIVTCILLLIAALTAVNWFKARKPDRPGISSVNFQDTFTASANPNLDNVSAEDNINRYLSRQDEIMTDMIQTMKGISKTGNATTDFLKGMIPHHESGILMSEAYLSYGGSNEKLKNLAETIISSRQEDIARIQDLSVKYESQDHSSEDKENAFLEDYNNLLNRNSEAGKSSGASLDQAFCDGLKEHHQMAVEIARSILEYTDYEEIRILAQNIITAEEQEINQAGDYNQ